MTTVLSILCALLALTVAILVYEVRGGLPRLRRRCVVNLTGGAGAITGVLWSRSHQWIVVKDAAHVALQSTVEERIPGEVLIDISRVDFIQVD